MFDFFTSRIAIVMMLVFAAPWLSNPIGNYRYNSIMPENWVSQNKVSKTKVFKSLQNMAQSKAFPNSVSQNDIRQN
jgi:hypothetical protein